MAFVFGCEQKAPVVNIMTGNNNSQDVSFTSAFDIEEGSALDLVVDTGKPGATITTSELPKNSVLNNGIFSFTPDYSQAGLYSVTFTITSGDTVTTKTIGIRVLNVIHISPPPLVTVLEGQNAGELTFTSDDPTGTIVTLSADISAVPGATFDSVTGKLSFKPKIDWLDTRTGAVAIIVTAEGQELDTGKQRVSTAKVLYQINEATSFKDELAHLFLLPQGTTGVPSPPPEIQDADGHSCISCHTPGSPPAGMTFLNPATPNIVDYQWLYDQLVDHDVAPAGNSDSAMCFDLAAAGYKRVVKGDINHSLWYGKISGTCPSGGSECQNGPNGPPCGAQMPETFPFLYLTTNNEDVWASCPNGDNPCKEAARCGDTDMDCKLQARLVRKARVWIEQGAPFN